VTIFFYKSSVLTNVIKTLVENVDKVSPLIFLTNVLILLVIMIHINQTTKFYLTNYRSLSNCLSYFHHKLNFTRFISNPKRENLLKWQLTKGDLNYCIELLSYPLFLLNLETHVELFS